MEGSRPLLMEVQALVTPMPPGVPAGPMRNPNGVNRNRFWLILAVLAKHTQMRVGGQQFLRILSPAHMSWSHEIAAELCVSAVPIRLQNDY